jgi:hypothetical protein
MAAPDKSSALTLRKRGAVKFKVQSSSVRRYFSKISVMREVEMMFKKTLTILAALIALAVAGQAQDRDVASLHQFNFFVATSGKLRLMLHNRVRFYNDISDFLQYRTGPIVSYDWKPQVQLMSGYYLIQQRSNDTFITIQRPWFGASVKTYGSDKLRVDWRTLLERHIYIGPGDFTRSRTRAITNFQPKSRWQPYASAEALALKGHVIGRYAAGLNYATERGHLFGFGYEFRQDIDKPGSHFLTTLIQLQITGPWKREKPTEEEAPD